MVSPWPSAWRRATARDFDRRVDACHGGSETGERLGDEAAAAADIQYGEPAQWLQLARRTAEMGDQRIADEAETGGALLVQRAQLAVGIPPLVGELLEAFDLGLIEVSGGCGRAGRTLRAAVHGAIRAAGQRIVKTGDIAGRVGCR